MRSKFQSIAGLIGAAFLVMGGMSVAHAQQNGAASTQQRSSANTQQNSTSKAQQNSTSKAQPNSTAKTEQNSAVNTQQKTVSNIDKGFADSALQDGMLQIALAKEAVAKTSNPKVKAFADRIIQDHTKANQQLKEIAQKAGLQLPDAMSSKEQKKLQRLSKLSGSKFDGAYIRFAVNSHKKAIKAFENEAKEGTDPGLKTFASQTTPTLQEHLSMAQSVHHELEASRSSGHSWWEFWKSGKNG